MTLKTTKTKTMTVKDAAAHFKVNERTVYRWIDKGQVEAKKNDEDRWLVEVDLSAVVKTGDVEADLHRYAVLYKDQREQNAWLAAENEQLRATFENHIKNISTTQIIQADNLSCLSKYYEDLTESVRYQREVLEKYARIMDSLTEQTRHKSPTWWQRLTRK